MVIQTYGYIRKSVAHAKIQNHLKYLIDDASLEKPFPKIGRVADVVWEQKKIVFEVQCSPISKEEVAKRCFDYEGMGYTPVWILYVKNFNHKILSQAELFLRKRLCYFADGFNIYDQFEVICDSQRLFRGPPLLVDVSAPFLLQKIEGLSLPKILEKRTQHIFFKGDLWSCFLQHPSSSLRAQEKKWERAAFSWRVVLKECLYNLLERIK